MPADVSTTMSRHSPTSAAPSARSPKPNSVAAKMNPNEIPWTLVPRKNPGSFALPYTMLRATLWDTNIEP